MEYTPKWWEHGNPKTRHGLGRKYTIDPVTGCWMWTASTIGGNPCMKVRGITKMSRRYYFEKKCGFIPKGKLETTCGQQRCVNPDHAREHVNTFTIPVPRKTHAIRAIERKEILMLKGCEKAEVIARMYNVSVQYVYHVNYRQR